MPSFSNTLMATATFALLATASAVPGYAPAYKLFKRADLECPASDGTEYAASTGGDYRIHCNTDTQSGSYFDLITAQNFDDCITACDAESSCNFVTFTGQSAATYGSCYLKTDNGGSYVSANGVYLARKLNPAYCQ